MSREAWLLIKDNKSFHVHMYRRGITLLILSLILSGIFAALIYYLYRHLPERDYYATSGVTSPIELKALTAPNESTTPLLEPDPPTDEVEKVIPQ
jgi:intracellular multiplication protein IcmM